MLLQSSRPADAVPLPLSLTRARCRRCSVRVPPRSRRCGCACDEMEDSGGQCIQTVYTGAGRTNDVGVGSSRRKCHIRTAITGTIGRHGWQAVWAEGWTDVSGVDQCCRRRRRFDVYHHHIATRRRLCRRAVSLVLAIAVRRRCAGQPEPVAVSIRVGSNIDVDVDIVVCRVAD